jgi:hypothetical protein
VFKKKKRLDGDFSLRASKGKKLRQIGSVQSLLSLPDDGIFRSNFYVPTEIKKGGKEKRKMRQVLLVFKGAYSAHFDPWHI